jgi:hypothetical protein
MQPSMAANGQSARSIVLHDYHDHSQVTMRDFILSKSGDINSSPSQRPRGRGGGGVLIPFPTMLHLILSIEETNGNANIFSW